MKRKLLFVFFLSFAFAPPLIWGAGSALETKIKAAYLYNFTKFVDWPQSSGKTIRICVSGDPQITKMLEDLASKQREKKEFSIHSAPKNDMSECDIFYISGSERELKGVMELTKGYDILTVSDNDRFNDHGGIVTFFSENGKLRFEINVQAARKTNLKISSKLLELSKTR